MKQPHTYVNGLRMPAHAFADAFPHLPGAHAIDDKPSRLQGIYKTPSRIYWNDKPLDIVRSPLGKPKGPCMLSHQLAKALGWHAVFCKIRGGSKVRTLVKDAVKWKAIHEPHRKLGHPLPIEPASNATMIPLSWLPALLDQTEDDGAWALADHLREVYPKSRGMVLPIDEKAMCRKGRPAAVIRPAEAPIEEHEEVVLDGDPPPEPIPPGGAAAPEPEEAEDVEYEYVEATHTDELAMAAGDALAALLRHLVPERPVHSTGELAALREQMRGFAEQVSGEMATTNAHLTQATRELRIVQADNARLKADNAALDARIAELEAFVDALRGVAARRVA